MASTPYPLPRQTRESSILVGNGTTGPYGPTPFKVFDILDVEVIAKADGKKVYSVVNPADYTIAKTAALDFDTVSVTFVTAVPDTTSFVIRARRTHERLLAVTRAGAIDAAQLEKELTRQGAVLSELRRDVDRAVFVDPGVTPVRVLPGNDNLPTYDATGNIVPSGVKADAVQLVADNMAAVLAAPANAATAQNAAVSTAADRIAVAADRTAVTGMRDEVEADRVDVQSNKVIAAASAGSAAAAQAAAEAARDQALAAFANFKDVHLGEFAADPATDIDGSPLEKGDLYFNTTDLVMKVYTGAVWGAAYVDGATVLLKSQNLDDLPNKATARTNLDVYSTAQVDALPGAAAGKTTPVDADSVQIVDSADGDKRKRLTFANLKTWLASWFSGQYATLAAIAGLAVADGNFIVGNGSTWVVESGATARTSLGLGSAATQASTAFATAAQGTTADGALARSGGTMTGKITLDGAPSADLHAATKKYVDDNAGGGSTLGTYQATTSGTEKDFTGIAAGTTWVDIYLDDVSVSGSDNILIQIGDSGGFETSGYLSSTSNAGAGAQSTSGFVILLAAASNRLAGKVRLDLIDASANKWVASGSAAQVGVNFVAVMGGVKSLSGVLDRVRITRTGANTFDLGGVNIRHGS